MSRWRGARSVTSRPPIEMLPSVTSSSPAIIRRSVDLPQPDGPTSTMNSPSPTVSETPSTARTPFGNSLATRSSTIFPTSHPLRRSDHAFTAPAVNPKAIFRWMRMKNTTTGIAVTVDAAINAPQSVWRAEPVKYESHTVSVCFDWS